MEPLLFSMMIVYNGFQNISINITKFDFFFLYIHSFFVNVFKIIWYDINTIYNTQSSYSHFWFVKDSDGVEWDFFFWKNLFYLKHNNNNVLLNLAEI